MKRDVIILGGGISGLALAWFLKQRGVDLLLLEKSERTGGWIQTLHKEDFLFELGPHSCRPHGTGNTTLQLIEALGLQTEVITAAPEAKQRYLFLNKQLVKLPSSPLSLLTSPFLLSLLKGGIRDLFHARRCQEEETISAFICRRFGREIAQNFMDPLTSGIYAGDPDKLSIRSCFPLLSRYEEQYGSVIRGLFARCPTTKPESPFVQQVQRAGLFSFRSGMERLTEALTEQLAPSIQLGCEATAIRFHEGGVEVECSSQQTFSARHLYSALPAAALAPLLLPNKPHCAALLQEIPYSSVAVIHLGYRHAVLKEKGFGYLIPSKEREPLLGVIWDSAVFPQQNRGCNETRLTVMMGGTRQPHLCALSDSKKIELALTALSKHLGIIDPPDVIHSTIAKNAIPQYYVGHEERLRSIQKELFSLSPHFSYIGNSFFGVSINDCISQAKKTALEYLN
jgi:oxygen-dependent protoporphyrinogen oxidase